MIRGYINYLQKFGTERIKHYSDFLLKYFNLSPIEKEYIRQLPEYYLEDCSRRQAFIDIMTELNLWYTLYLTNY